ncbi:uncharacterized protein PFLUO_LOCUS8323 [Penicillium psychrofluorescens]|uniref:uncharacterized protein n=1 Tax=Penicillium psychrofluorescens TaxID=3158075 RepID=UPI003CCDD576
MKVARPELTIVHPSLLTTVLEASQAAGINHSKIFQFSDRPTTSPQGSTPDLRSILPSLWEAESYDWLDLRGKAAQNTTAAINFSSGTTGLPKGVSISHHNMVANLEQVSFITKLDTQKATNGRWVGFLPMYHAYGQLYSCLMCVLLSNPVYIMTKFDFIDLMQTIQNYRLTTIHLVPPVLKMMADRPETAQYDLSSVQDVLCGAAPLSPDLRDRIRTRFGIIIREGYGMTELTCAAMQTPIRLAQEGLLTAEGDEAADGRPGELYIHGPQVFQSYWLNEMATKESKTLDGWLKTGDIALRRHAEFWIVDRGKELIKVNGLQVSPAELEAILGENSYVSDAAVVGVATERGEAPRAYVSIKDEAKDHTTEEQLAAWVAHRVARHKWLTGGVMIVDGIPRLASGKIDRKIIRGWTKGESTQDTRSKL